jgi:hypothetical protein
MEKFITFRRNASILVMLTATLALNAQTEDPWHVIVYDNNDKEVATHSVEIIDDVVATAEDVTFVLSTGASYNYPISSMFGFDHRKGNGTAVEFIAAPKWGVHYSNGNLHFTEQVSSIAVYTMFGSLVTRVTGNSYTDVKVNLAQGIYIVQADGKSAKLLVTGNGGGGTMVQPMAETLTQVPQAPQVSQASQAPSYTANPVSLRAGTAIKQWWNVNAGNTITPIEIAKVDKWQITLNNEIVFNMKDGNTIQLAAYHTMSFSTEPTQSQNTKWDRKLTTEIGGASYVTNWDIIGDIYDICVVAVAKDYVVAEGVFKKLSKVKIAKNNIIYPNFLTKKLSYAYSINGYKLASYSEVLVGSVPVIAYWYYDWSNVDPTGHAGSLKSNFSFNGGTPSIPTTFKFNADESLTMSFKDIRTGTNYSVTLTP